MPHPAIGDLDTALLAAHAAQDGPRLAQLYGEAADLLIAAGDADAACFFWTQAYVFALEAGAQEADRFGGLLRERARL